MKIRWMLFVVIVAFCSVFISCGNVKKQEKADGEAMVTMTVDQVMEYADSLVGATVKLEGICTHICSHGAKKMFLVGSDNTKTLRVEAGELGAFDADVVNRLVTVQGSLIEERIDEGYLQNWEAQLHAKEVEQHGNEEGGCQTEKDARGEKSNTSEARIADFRSKIAAMKETTGKEYLSFYYVVAESYEINE